MTLIKFSNSVFIISVKIDYNTIKGTEYFVSLQMSVLLMKEYNITVNSEGFILVPQNI
jgi:hypothetical protein